MRKWITILVLAALLSALMLTGQAAQSRLNVDDVEIKPGETVYVKLELTQSTVGDSVGVIYTYDPAVLKPLKSSSTWARKGLLQDFDTKKSTGVWADSTASDLKGLVCTLAFEVVSKEDHFDTEVTCTLMVKNGSKDVGTYTAEAKVSTFCEHQYGSWKDGGTLGHTRTCRTCNRSESQSHKWDNGTTSAIPNRPGMEETVYTCKNCGATRKYEHISNSKPTAPQETVPPETEPMRPTRPTEPSNPGGNQGGSSGDPEHTSPTVPGDDDHTHVTIPGNNDEPTRPIFPGFNDEPTRPTFPGFNDEPTRPTVPGNDHNQGNLPTVGDDHDHDHSSNPVVPVVDSKTKTRNVLVFFGTLVVLGGAAWFFMKKKRR